MENRNATETGMRYERYLTENRAERGGGDFEAHADERQRSTSLYQTGYVYMYAYTRQEMSVYTRHGRCDH